jgi:transposase
METIAETKRKYDSFTHEQFIELIATLQGKIDGLMQALFQKKSERLHEDPQGMSSMFDEIEELAEAAEVGDYAGVEAEDETVAVGPFTRKKRGKRKLLPENLPRERVEYDLSEEDKICKIHGTKMEKIGEKVSEKIEIIPAKSKILQEARFSYKCSCCSDAEVKDSIITAPAVPSIIPKSFSTPSLLAYIATAKFHDGLPLYRQEKIFQRYEIDLDRTTMARWMIQCAIAAQPLINLMQEDLLERAVIGCDETPLQVLKEPQRNAEQKSYMWVTRSMFGKSIIVFHYHQGRSTKTANEILGDYSGVVVCDGLKTYDSFAKDKATTLAACMAHIRRKFMSAHKALKKANPKAEPRTTQPLKLIKELYKIEAEIKGQTPESIQLIRQQRSKLLMDCLKEWVDTHQSKVLPKSLTGKAITYALDQWGKMSVFIEHPLVPIDNNSTERSIRPFVIGRKNWLFAATPKGAHASATIYSLIESAKENSIEPFEYLKLIFNELPKAKTLDDYKKLLPHEIKMHYDLQCYSLPT